MARNLSSNGPTKDDNKFSGAIDGEALRQYAARARNLMIRQKDLSDDIKEICAEADERGVCSKSELRRIARLSLTDQETLEAKREREDMLLHALGDFANLPLGEAALNAEKPKRGPGRPRKNPAHEALDKAEAHLNPPWEDPPFGNA